MASEPRRDWTDALAKKEREKGRCRVTGRSDDVQLAHTAGRRYDRPRHPGAKTLWVDPDGVVLLHVKIHQRYDKNDYDLLPYLTLAEQLYMVRVLGGIAAAYRRATGSRL